MGEGYAQADEHLREMEREAYETGNMCFRDWEDSVKSTIYFEHLQKGEKKMSIKDWKNKEIGTLLSEAWGFKFNSLEEFDEFNGSGELQAEGEEEIEEIAGVTTRRQPRRTPKLQKDRRPQDDEESTEKTAPAPPRVVNKGKKKMAEADDIDESEELDESEEVVEESDELEEKKHHDDDDKDKMEESEDQQEELKEAIATLLRKHLQG